MSHRQNDANHACVPTVPSRREVLIAGASLITAPFVGGMTAKSQPGRSAEVQAAAAATEWLSYAGDKSSSKYSPLAQIGPESFSRLRIAWTWRSAEEAVVKANPQLRTWVWEATPLMVDGVLYVATSLSQAAAIDAATGETKWVYDPETWKNGTPSNNGFVHRGVAYWADGNDRRILFGTGDGYLICLNGQTGKPVSSFGQNGRIDLTQGLGRTVNRRHYGVSSPPIICRDVIVMGSKVHDIPVAQAMPPGDVRGFDVRTGKQLWQFRAVPGEGEFGNRVGKAVHGRRPAGPTSGRS
jgi:quinoprotein glucose dehydrogenase